MREVCNKVIAIRGTEITSDLLTTHEWRVTYKRIVTAPIEHHLGELQRPVEGWLPMQRLLCDCLKLRKSATPNVIPGTDGHFSVSRAFSLGSSALPVTVTVSVH